MTIITAVCRRVHHGAAETIRHVIGRAQEEVERRRWTRLIGIDAGDGDQASGTNVFDRGRGRIGLEVRVEHRLANPAAQAPLVRVREHAQETALHAHERGVVVRRQHAVGLHGGWGWLPSFARHPEDGVGQNRFARRDGWEPGHFDQRARPHTERLLGLNAGATRAIVYIDDVLEVAKSRGARVVADFDRPTRNIAGNHAADSDAALHLATGE